MSKDLFSKITEDLEKSGFATEMRAAQICMQHGWHCHPSATYTDQDERKLREIDIIASKGMSSHEEPAITRFALSIEVKKAKAPWVIFKRRGLRPYGMDPNLRFKNLPSRLVPFPAKFQDIGPWARDWFGYAIHEAFKSPDEPSRAYRAMMSACKAAYEHAQYDYDAAVDKDLPEYQVGGARGSTPAVVFMRPVVVLDAPLFSAEMSIDGKIEIQPVPWAPVRHSIKSDNYVRQSPQPVDVVSIEAFDEYVSRITTLQEETHALISDT